MTLERLSCRNIQVRQVPNGQASKPTELCGYLQEPIQPGQPIKARVIQDGKLTGELTTSRPLVLREIPDPLQVPTTVLDRLTRIYVGINRRIPAQPGN